MLQRLRNHDWSFIRSSTLMSVGLAVGRLMGLLFWLVLARLFSNADTGHVRYVITLAELSAMATIPFAMHVVTYFVSRHRSDLAYLRKVLGTAWVIQLALTAATVVVATIVLLVIGRFEVAILLVFLGQTLFFSYYGLARGHLEQGKLLAAFIGSNLTQIVAVAVAVLTLGTASTTPILWIYGTCYLLPILILQWKYPIPVYFAWKRPDPQITRSLLAFAAPMWVSHILYTLFTAVDILMIEYFLGKAAVGVYAVTRTLTAVFQLIPWALEIMLMPRIAASASSEHGRLIRNALVLIFAASIVALAGYIIGYRWFIETFVGREYFAGMGFAIIMAIAAVLSGLQGITASVLIGRSQPGIEAAGRFATLLATTAVGLMLVPPADPLGVSRVVSGLLGMDTTGLTGVALATLLGAVAGLATYAALLAFTSSKPADPTTSAAN